MANNKVQLADGTVLIDLTSTTAVASDVRSGKVFFNAAGAQVTGTLEETPSQAIITTETDAAGGTIYHITTDGSIDLSQDTVTAATLLQGYTAHDASGNAITGTYAGTTPVLGTKTITENGTYAASSDSLDGYSSVTVNIPSSSPSLQSKSVSPTTSEQTVTPDSGYDGLSSVTVGAVQVHSKSVTPNETVIVVTPDTGKYLSSVDVRAISKTYVGSGIDRNDSSDLTASGATVTVPAGYYEEDASKAIASGSASTPATTITANPTISVSASGLITATASASQSVTPSVSAGYISSGTAGTVSVSGSNTQQLTTQAATTVTPTKSTQTVGAAGRYMTGAVTIEPIPANYITTTDATASASDILSGESAYVNGSKVTGTLVIQHYYTSTSDPTSSDGDDGDIWLVTGA